MKNRMKLYFYGALAFCSLFYSITLAEEKETISFHINATQNRHTISPYIYGANSGYNSKDLIRVGGNRLTAYNWENNASNAGSDWYFQNDNYLTWAWGLGPEHEAEGYSADTPGAAIWLRIQQARQKGAASLITVPILGYVAADKNGGGDVGQTADYLSTRFYKSFARKKQPFSISPDTSDNAVYQDEFVNWLERTFFPNGRENHLDTPPVLYCLDNEPGLWAETHSRIHPNQEHYNEFLSGTRNYQDIQGKAVTYDKLIDLNIEYASAIKDVVPEAEIFGFVSYGYYSYTRLQGAPDANGRDFIKFYLEQMKAAESLANRRLIDVLDLHWYPEAKGGGIRITSADAFHEVALTRMQAPRSLWDESYIENSWITQATGNPICLIPWLRVKIDQCYPGTKLAFTEYYYGGGNHISGAIAQADVLGILGRDNVFAASLWPIGEENDFIYGAMDMYRNYDGNHGSFGDISIDAVTADIEKTSVYASLDSQNPGRMVVIAINKTEEAIRADIRIENSEGFNYAEVYQLTASSSSPQHMNNVNITSEGILEYRLPGFSVSTLVLVKNIKRPIQLRVLGN